jgi:hypothetical protein
MGRFSGTVLALALAAPVMLLPAASHAIDRSLPMRFVLRLEGPAQDCGAKCRTFISASGAITADTPSDFTGFAQGRDLAGALVVLDSTGGSVHGAIALGREIRKLNLDTTVGVVADLDRDQGAPRAKLSPRADCESMCAFVLLAGVHRSVPGEARVMVHQIWLGDRRDDPTAANYSAEDLVLVQRDIGKLAQYTIEMGASIEVLDIALRIPPWEPMHNLTRQEILSARVANVEVAKPAATVATSPPRAAPSPAAADAVRPTAISERQWAVVDRAGSVALARSNLLTFEGEEIGDFDLMVSCSAEPNSYDVRYVERRHVGSRAPMPREVLGVTMSVAEGSAALKLVSSVRRSEPDELVTTAAATVPAALIDAFAGLGNHSMLIETKSDSVATGIRLGNTGAQQNLPQLAASCAKPLGDRAELLPKKPGGALAAK